MYTWAQIYTYIHMYIWAQVFRGESILASSLSLLTSQRSSFPRIDGHILSFFLAFFVSETPPQENYRRIHLLPRTATHCNALQHTPLATHCLKKLEKNPPPLTHCNKLQRTATHSTGAHDFKKLQKNASPPTTCWGSSIFMGFPLQLTPLQHTTTHYLKKLEKNPPPPTTCWGSSILMGFP